jgi:hypothetical protein
MMSRTQIALDPEMLASPLPWIPLPISATRIRLLGETFCGV